MSVIIARTYSGGKDLYMMSDNFTDAKITKSESSEDVDDYITTFTIKDNKGFEQTIQIRQEKE